MAQKQTAIRSLVDIREHVLYVGVTQTGKTTLARHHAAILARAGYDVVIYDPVETATINGTWPKDCEILHNPEEFHKRLENLKGTEERPIFLFVDEAADIFSHSETEAHWIPRRIRHEFVYLRMIAQRPKMLHPNVRTQCAVAYMLRLSLEDAKILCADFGHGSEVSSVMLDKGDCMLLISGSADVEEFNVFEHLSNRRKENPS